MSYYPLNYEINYFGKMYRFNATELAWLTALLQGANKIYTSLDSYNVDLQSLMQKGLIDEKGMLTRDGIFIAEYVFIVHPMIKENPLFSLTYDFIFNTDTIGIDMKTKYESVEPKYNFQKKIKNYLEKMSNQLKESLNIKPIERVDLEEAMAVEKKKPFGDIYPIESSFIKGIGYNDDTQEMDVHMSNGQIYRYSEVPSMVYNALITADTRTTDYGVKLKTGADMKSNSVGSYFSKMIKNNYKAIRIA